MILDAIGAHETMETGAETRYALDLSKLTPVGTDHDGPPKSVLLGRVVINSVWFHVEAIAMEDDENGRKAVAKDKRVNVESFGYGAETDTAFRLIKHEGHEYALFIYPFSE